MKNRNILLTWIYILVFTCVSNSCKIIDSADRHFEYYEYAKAIPEYEKYLKKDTSNAEVWARLGDCYRLNNQTIEAEASYKKAIQYKTVNTVNKLYYAQMMVSNGKYAEAHTWMDDYMKSDPGDSRALAIHSGISRIEDFTRDKNQYKVQKLTINTTEAEYGTAIYKEGIIFSSSRQGDSWAERSHSWTGKNYYSLYYSKGRETNFETPVVFLKGVQTKYNNSSVCFNKSGTEMFLTRNNIENGKVKTGRDHVVRLKMHIAKLKDGMWAEVIPFQYNSEQYSCAHPALSADGTNLYFSSDMPGTIGGMDLWVCTRTPDGWSTPKNLGPAVNTPGNEIFPTTDDEGVIYFSSNSREGLGGLDIYSTADSAGSFTQPMNAGAPVNSSDDDFGLIWAEKNKVGYLSSNRTLQGTNDDIFCITKNTLLLSGLVFDKNSGLPIHLSKVSIVEEDTLIGTKETNDAGNFTSTLHLDKSYLLIAGHENYKTDTIRLASSELITSGDTIFIKIPLEKDELLISMEGKVYNITTGNPVDSARVLLVNLSLQDTLEMITGPDGMYQFAQLEPENRYRVIADANYCLPNSVDTSTIGIKEDKILRIDIGVYCLGDGIVLRNIYYDLDKYNIRPDAAIELDKLVELLKKYPLINIELGAHTDCRASAAYNKRLSQNRATSAVAYLVKQGIDARRMKAHGYGESVLVNRCECEVERKSDCTEEEHQLNRRTEIKILSWNGIAISSR